MRSKRRPPTRARRLGPAGQKSPAPDQRLEPIIDDALTRPDNAPLRRLAKAAIEVAQQVKHIGEPTRTEAGIAADGVILLANILRRLAEPL